MRPEGAQTPGQLVQELAESRVTVGQHAQGLEAVDDYQPGAPVLEHGGDMIAHPGEPVAAGHLAQVLIEHRLADRGGIEEVQGLAEADDLLQRLGQGEEIHRGPVRAGVVKGVLLGDDRLAGARQAHDDADPVAWKAAAQDVIERLVSAAQAVAVHRLLRLAAGPSSAAHAVAAAPVRGGLPGERAGRGRLFQHWPPGELRARAEQGRGSGQTAEKQEASDIARPEATRPRAWLPSCLASRRAGRIARDVEGL